MTSRTPNYLYFGDLQETRYDLDEWSRCGHHVVRTRDTVSNEGVDLYWMQLAMATLNPNPNVPPQWTEYCFNSTEQRDSVIASLQAWSRQQLTTELYT